MKGVPSALCQAVHEVNTNIATEIIQVEPTGTLKQLVIILDIWERSASTILTKKLNFSHVCVKGLLRLLTNEMKAKRVCVCKYVLERPFSER